MKIGFKQCCETFLCCLHLFKKKARVFVESKPLCPQCVTDKVRLVIIHKGGVCWTGVVVSAVRNALAYCTKVEITTKKTYNIKTFSKPVALQFYQTLRAKSITLFG